MTGGGSLRVMIVEDDEVAAEVLQVYVRSLVPNATLNWCWDGYEALSRVAGFRPHLILLDYMMPRLDGKEFLRSIPNLVPEIRPYVAVVSAYADELNTREFIEAGADRVEPKPITSETIARLIAFARQKHAFAPESAGPHKYA